MAFNRNRACSGKMRTPTPEIRQAFYSRLLSLMPFQDLCESDIAWPNTGFMADPARIYLAPSVMFGETTTETLGPHGYEKLSGIFQISICGLPNAGEGKLDEIARTLIDHFRGGSGIDLCGWWSIRLLKAWRSPLLYGNSDSADRPTVAVSVAWQQFTQKGE